MKPRHFKRNLPKYYGIEDKPAPCDDCEYRKLCKEELLACEAFNAYVQRNQVWDKERRPAGSKEFIPNKHIWDKIFIHDKDEEDRR